MASIDSNAHRGIVRVAGHEPMPSDAQPFATFRASIQGPGGTRGPWWLWDGSTEWRVDTLSQELTRWPLREIWNDTLLVERLLSGWRHEHDT